jgi:TRAP-type C4-dicarboxylate transport system permease small subunit
VNQPLLVTIVGAILSGLSFIAYKHPEGYRRIFVVVFPICVFVAFIICEYHVGYIYAVIGSAYDDLQRYPDAALKDHAFPIQELYAKREFVRTFLMYFVPAIGYLAFLRFLPEILGLGRSRDRI